jgi:hypothetical protein
MYIKRNAKGQIEQVSREANEECREFLPPGSPELQAFVGDDQLIGDATFSKSDLDFVRVLEDVINLLMDKGVIRFTDLPDPAQQKLINRQSLRKRANDVGLIGSDENSDVI